MAKTTSSKSATFKLFAPKAKRVSLAGSFNNWDTKAHAAKKDLKGNWAAKISLKPGRYEYKFFVDGTWINDPSCNGGCITNSFGTQNCIVEIK
ncbi:MAG: glycogen-binding domain-containing protein [Candidatus Omnitrophica bacterium]|jgi:1,4-alpha-glucan branching enzyme|nr:glycogen-binding domain-containing protein [Candidatus Omnitrophota bacterium]